MRLGAFDRRLDPETDSPVAVAVSGGADSLLALRRTLEWAEKACRPVIAFSVDHGLQPASHAWTDFALDEARRFGARTLALAWDEPRPAAGVAAAARQARHRLLANAAREAGARVIVTGHTASDQAENARLGQGLMPEWSPSPVWPEGRGIFLLRPLLHLDRQAVRRAMNEAGAAWVDDPANINPLRPRARVRLSSPEPLSPPADDTDLRALARHVMLEEGLIRAPQAALRAAPVPAAQRLIAIAATCAGGGAAPARAAAAERIAGLLASGVAVDSTLAGARVHASGGDVIFFRNAGEYRRLGEPVLRLGAGETGVWDGRYEIRVAAGGQIRPAAGRLARLGATSRRLVHAQAAAVRPTLPVMGQGDSPILAAQAGADVRWLVPARFAAACGVLMREADL